MERCGKRMDELLILGYFVRYRSLCLNYHDTAPRLYRLAPTVGTVDMSTNKNNFLTNFGIGCFLTASNSGQVDRGRKYIFFYRCYQYSGNLGDDDRIQSPRTGSTLLGPCDDVEFSELDRVLLFFAMLSLSFMYFRLLTQIYQT